MTGVFNKQTKLQSKLKTSLLSCIFKADPYFFILLFLPWHMRHRERLQLLFLKDHSCF